MGICCHTLGIQYMVVFPLDYRGNYPILYRDLSVPLAIVRCRPNYREASVRLVLGTKQTSLAEPQGLPLGSLEIGLSLVVSDQHDDTPCVLRTKFTTEGDYSWLAGRVLGQ
jgi:hypothetical protein